MTKIVMITGASSGIGEATAHRFAAEGFALIITGRRGERLDKLALDLRTLYPVDVLPLSFDVRNPHQVSQAISGLAAEWQAIDILVNNAGLSAGLDPIHQGVEDRWERMIDTNLKGLLYVTRAISPGMVERRCGHIINIGSIAGKEAYPNGNVYGASKFAVDGLTKGMRIDLAIYGIRVTHIAPGAVNTEFSLVRFDGDQQRADAVYQGFQPLSGSDVADAIYYAASLPPHVNINDLVIMPVAQPIATIIHRS